LQFRTDLYAISLYVPSTKNVVLRNLEFIWVASRHPCCDDSLKFASLVYNKQNEGKKVETTFCLLLKPPQGSQQRARAESRRCLVLELFLEVNMFSLRGKSHSIASFTSFQLSNDYLLSPPEEGGCQFYEVSVEKD